MTLWVDDVVQLAGQVLALGGDREPGELVLVGLQPGEQLTGPVGPARAGSAHRGPTNHRITGMARSLAIPAAVP